MHWLNKSLKIDRIKESQDNKKWRIIYSFCYKTFFFQLRNMYEHAYPCKTPVYWYIVIKIWKVCICVFPKLYLWDSIDWYAQFWHFIVDFLSYTQKINDLNILTYFRFFLCCKWTFWKKLINKTISIYRVDEDNLGISKLSLKKWGILPLEQPFGCELPNT